MFQFVHAVCFSDEGIDPCLCSPLETALSRFQPSTVSGLTFELANANGALACTDLTPWTVYVVYVTDVLIEAD